MIFQTSSRLADPGGDLRRMYCATKFPFPPVFLCLALFVCLPAIVGCKDRSTETNLRNTEVGDLMEAPSPDEIIDAKIQYEIANLRAQAMQKDFVAQSEPSQDKKLSPTEKIEQLIVEGHLLTAADETNLISDLAERDSYLEDIVRRLIVHAVRSMKNDFPISGSVQAVEIAEDTVRQADKICRKISSPMIRSEVFGSIGVFCTGQKLPKKAVEMMNNVVLSLDQVQGTPLIKARKYCQTARWFLGQDERTRALNCCVQAKKEADHVDNAFEASVLYLDLADLFLLLDDGEKTKDAIEKTRRLTDKISEPKEKATVLLKLASEWLDCPLKIAAVSNKKKNEIVKELVRQADRLIAAHFEENSVATEPSVSTAIDQRTKLDAMHGFLTRSFVWPWPEIKTQRNEILARISKTQVWTDSLEEAWDTILEIEDGPQRDGAVAEVVDMFLTTENRDEAEVWAEEIADQTLKNSVLERIEAAKKENPSQKSPKTGDDP